VIDVPCPPDPKSHDPNAKTGPAGYGPQGFITANAALPYRVDFENDPTATAPAQRVVVSDQLDPNIDWNTFQFTGVGFGDNNITIPVESQHFQTTVSMTYAGLTFDVEIELGLNTNTGLVTATFQSIDPNTELPPPVLIGFLPPEDGTGRGMGYFSYMAMPKAGLPTGTQIHNVATVTFDVNPPITTDQVNENDPSQGVDPAKECLNTIDSVAPTSSVTALPAFSPGNFTVNWSGQDNPGGSGIDSFKVYVSDNGGPYTLWQNDTTNTSATFTGVNGHTYAFYSVAFDNAGNVQSQPTSPQATTTVDTVPPISTVAPLPATETSPSFTVNWSGTDNTGGSGIASYSIYVSDNGGAFTPFLHNTTQTSATFTGQAGHTYGFYSVATDNVGNVQATPAGAQATTTVSQSTTTPISVVSAQTVSAMQGVNTGSVLLATFTQGTATQSASAYTATVAWGDGHSDTSTETNSPITIQVSGQTISVYGSHTYTTAGTQNLSVTLVTTGTSAMASPTATVVANVTADVSVKRSGFRYDFTTHEFVQTITITNTSSSTLFGSLALQLLSPAWEKTLFC
jgi:hypothetical protein